MNLLESQEACVVDNARFLAENICHCIEAMTGMACSIIEQPDAFHKPPHEGIVIIINFLGSIQGYYVMSLNESIATNLMGLENSPTVNQPHLEFYASHVDFFKEVLNTASAKSISGLDKTFGDITYFTPMAVIGHAVFPEVLSKTIKITTPTGPIFTSVMIDLVKPKIAQKLHSALDSLSEKTKEANTDGLTSLYNHTFFELVVDKAITEMEFYKSRLGIMMFDVDHFKEINDRYGHLYGDQVLKAIAHTLLSLLSDTDIPARYGGDEFIVALPNRYPGESIFLAQSIRSAIKKNVAQNLLNTANIQPEITVSMGITELTPDDTYQTFIRRVDSLLYSAKRAGRNTFVSG